MPEETVSAVSTGCVCGVVAINVVDGGGARAVRTIRLLMDRISVGLRPPPCSSSFSSDSFRSNSPSGPEFPSLSNCRIRRTTKAATSKTPINPPHQGACCRSNSQYRSCVQCPMEALWRVTGGFRKNSASSLESAAFCLQPEALSALSRGTASLTDPSHPVPCDLSSVLPWATDGRLDEFPG